MGSQRARTFSQTTATFPMCQLEQADAIIPAKWLECGKRVCVCGMKTLTSWLAAWLVGLALYQLK